MWKNFPLSNKSQSKVAVQIIPPWGVSHRNTVASIFVQASRNNMYTIRIEIGNLGNGLSTLFEQRTPQSVIEIGSNWQTMQIMFIACIFAMCCRRRQETEARACSGSASSPASLTPWHSSAREDLCPAGRPSLQACRKVRLGQVELASSQMGACRCIGLRCVQQALPGTAHCPQTAADEAVKTLRPPQGSVDTSSTQVGRWLYALAASYPCDVQRRGSGELRQAGGERRAASSTDRGVAAIQLLHWLHADGQLTTARACSEQPDDPLGSKHAWTEAEWLVCT